MWRLLVVVCVCMIGVGGDCPNVRTEISAIRKRRHVSFPEGADFVMTISLVKAFMTHAPSGWNLALEIDVLFPLPDVNFTSAIYRRKLHHRQKREFWERLQDALDYKSVHNLALEVDILFPLPDANFTSDIYRRKLHHTQKKEFWERLQNALDYHNLNGQACILRSICEAKTHLADPGKSLVHDLLRVIFTAPLHERGFVEEVRGRYEDLLHPHLCDKVNDCPISLLQVVLALNKQRY